MRIVLNDLIPFKGFVAINLFGILFVRNEYANKINDVILNHEAIHTAQMKELLWVPFYIIYFIEWLIRLFINDDAYRNISFEKEAYNNEKDLEYLSKRKSYSMWRN